MQAELVRLGTYTLSHVASWSADVDAARYLQGLVCGCFTCKMRETQWRAGPRQ